MSYTEEQREVLEAIGLTLLMLQTSEKIIRICMTFVIQKQASLTFDLYKQQEEAEKKKTIGYFLAELRKRVDVDDSLDELLVDFLNNRNSFVHDLSSFEAWDFHKNKSALQSKKLVFDFMKQTDKVMKIFAGLILSWQEQVQTQTDRLGPVLPNHEWFNEVDSVYKPLMDRLFFAKD